jgi:hypothetical protein
MTMLIGRTLQFYLTFHLLAAAVDVKSPAQPTNEVQSLAQFFMTCNGPNWVHSQGWEAILTTDDVSSLDPCDNPRW